jgi:hypothetical protein
MDANDEAVALEKRLESLNSEYLTITSAGDPDPGQRARLRAIDEEHSRLKSELHVRRQMVARREA